MDAKPKKQRKSESNRHALFVKEYLISFNATKAAIAAGYSAKGAKQAGSRLLTHVDVLRQMEQATKKISNKLELTGQMIIEELAKIAFKEDYEIGAMETYKAADKIKCLELLGKWHEMGLWKETVEIKKAPEERSEHFRELISEVRVLYGSLKLERGK